MRILSLFTLGISSDNFIITQIVRVDVGFPVGQMSCLIHHIFCHLPRPANFTQHTEVLDGCQRRGNLDNVNRVPRSSVCSRTTKTLRSILETERLPPFFPTILSLNTLVFDQSIQQHNNRDTWHASLTTSRIICSSGRIVSQQLRSPVRRDSSSYPSTQAGRELLKVRESLDKQVVPPITDFPLHTQTHTTHTQAATLTLTDPMTMSFCVHPILIYLSLPGTCHCFFNAGNEHGLRATHDEHMHGCQHRKTGVV